MASLPPPRPKSPPEYPDLYGKRREIAKVQMLEREISFLEGELRFVESLQPASRCCKEVADFVVANSDPFMPIIKKTHTSCSPWKWLCRAPCLFLSSICCFGCKTHLKKPRCPNCNMQNPQCPNCNMQNCCPSCLKCSIPKCRYCPCPSSQCLGDISCNKKCCLPSCFRFKCCSCNCRFSCPEVNLCCCCCTNNCFYCCC